MKKYSSITSLTETSENHRFDAIFNAKWGILALKITSRQIFRGCIICLMVILFAGCAKNGADESENNSPSVTQRIANNNSEADKQKNTALDGGVDVDLTVLSSTMVYAEVYNMMVNPDEYMGKTIKMSGPYSVSVNAETGVYYHYVIIEDATACCQSGLEFIWKGEHNYPDDYPPDQTKIEVAGVFESYEEFGQTYYCLAVNDISVLK